jgi:hypothetical protein
MNDGGPAFPMTEYSGKGMSYDEATRLYQYSGPHYGMSLRDYFAGQALAGFLAMCADTDAIVPKPDDLASNVYKIADAMMVERAKFGG